MIVWKNEKKAARPFNKEKNGATMCLSEGLENAFIQIEPKPTQKIMKYSIWVTSLIKLL